MTKKFGPLLLLGIKASFCLYLAIPGAAAQGMGDAGGSDNSGGQGFLDEKGGLFMEEVTPEKPKKPIPKVPIDLSRVGVSVDPSGHIVPIKDNFDDPWAGSGVKPFQNTISNTFQPIYQPIYSPFAPYGYGYPGAFPAGFFPGYSAFPGYPNYNPGYSAFTGYPNYNPGYSAFPSYPNYNPGYSAFPGYPNYFPGYGQFYQPALTLNIGKFQAAIGSVPLPGTGFGYPGYAGPNFSYPGFNAMLPNNTTYTQSSMWRAFNLAF